MKQHPIFKTYYATEDGKIWSEKSNKFLKGSLRVRGKRKKDNLTIQLCLDGKKAGVVCISRFVWECFNECVLMDGVDFIHKDGNWQNCSFDNLEPEIWYFGWKKNRYWRVCV